jgi:hypothetical protein
MRRPGDFGLIGRGGPFWVRVVGWWINFGQIVIGDVSPYIHAVIAIDETTIFEARPGGAGFNYLSNYAGRERVFSQWDLTPSQRSAIIRSCQELVGTPYSFLDYLALALDHWHIRPAMLVRYMESKDHMICSQLVDEVYRRAGIQLFDDGRQPQDVTPGDLEDVLIEKKEG